MELEFTAEELISKLHLKPHPEGGYYIENYKSKEFIKEESLPGRYEGFRVFGTSIYFLLTSEEPSLFHRIKSDEIWHFHLGGSAKIHKIKPDGTLREEILGKNIDKGEQFQVIIPHGNWFAAEVTSGDYILASCVVNPGFEFEDFELGEREDLLEEFPQHSELIERFTKYTKD